jgi:tungstate transport system ATP-binding protein
MYKGRPVDWREKHLGGIRRQVVLVDQHPIMFSTTVVKNVEYGLKMRGLGSGERLGIALECLDRVGMKDFAQRPAHLLSGGETQMVAIARAMACRPQVMLFDEPTASVDVENQAVIESVIRDIRAEKGITVIFSTHKRLEAARLGENKVFMFEGKLTGPGGENLLSGTVVSRGGQNICLIRENVELEIVSGRTGQCRVFVRPEKIRIYRMDKIKGSSSGSPLTGRVLQMTAEGGHIKVLLDVGVPLRTIMTRQEAVESGIFVGDQVRVEFAPDAAYTEP